MSNESGSNAAYTAVHVRTLLSPDTEKPHPGTLSIIKTGFTTIELDWTPATDNRTDADNLQYKLVRSTNAADINSITLANFAGIIVIDWSTNITAIAGSLTNKTTYHFTLLVRDEAGNQALYNMAQASTKAFETKVYFDNGISSSHITGIDRRYSSSEA